MGTRLCSGLAVLAFLVAGCGGGELPADLALEVSPLTLTFASVTTGEDVARTVTLKHIGTTGTIKVAISLSAATSPDFSFDDPAKKDLLPGESTSVVVHYKPQGGLTGASGELVVAHNVPPAYQTSVSLKALAGGGDLVADPDPIDFGNVSVAAQPFKDLDVILKNFGTTPLTITDLRLKSLDTDFQILEGSIVTPGGQPLPADLTARQSVDSTLDQVGLTVRYTPKGGGCDATELWVMRKDQGVPTAFQVTGCELGPKIVVSPGQVDFGYVKPGDTKTVSVTLSNDGNDDLVVTDLALVDGTDAGLAVAPTPATSTPSGPWLLKPGENKPGIVVSWKATTAHDPTLPFDNLRVMSNDANAGSVLIPVFGTLDAPDLALVPGDVVDFGVVAQTISTQRTLTLRNDGHGDLTVKTITIDKSVDTLDEFAIVPDNAFPPTHGAGDGTVAGYAAWGVTLQFTNKGADHGDLIVPLTVTSDSPGKESLSVPLKVTRGGKATCEPVLIPATTNFGNLALGNSKTLSVNVHNKGTGNCSFVTARIDDCKAGMLGGATCSAAFKGSASQAFSILTMPPATMNGIGPGMDAPIAIKFAPPDVFTLFGAVNQFYGLLAVKLLDSNVGPGVTPPEIVLPAGAAPTPNLVGSGGVPQMVVQPGEVKFGLVTIGCFSKTFQVCLYSSGNAPVALSDISLSGCSPEFKLKDVPPLPKDVNAGLKVCFGVAFAPQDTNAEQCQVVIQSDAKGAPVVSIPLSGTGTYDSEQTDQFIQANGQTVDVLFIIDDSSSMCDWQSVLIKNYPDFISHASLGNDYHIGIIDVNVLDEQIMGKLNLGDPAKKPRYITPGPQASQQFGQLADIGCAGCPDYTTCTAEQNSSAQESGLAAAMAALTAPLTTDTHKPCTADADCTGDPTLCGDPKQCPYYCIDGTCGGWNKGFLRDDAQLEFILLSDEEDQSSQALAFYIDFMKNIKGFYNVGMMHFNEITWEMGACDQTSAQTDGKRYREAATQTGGQQWFICGDPYAQFMDAVGLAAFQPKVQFFLTRLADPPTVTVKVDGKACSSGWKYDSNSNSVVFDQNGACMPEPGQSIEVHYKTLCLTS